MSDNTHPGFDTVARGIASRTDPNTGKPYGMQRARAILASRSRSAPPAAKKKNPNLRKVSQ